MNKNYRWGILGAGRIAAKFCEALCFVEGSEVYAVASRNEENAKAYKAKYNASVHYSDYDDLIKDEKVDIIYIATPHVFHYEQTMKCLANNKPVLCEKPLAVSYKQTQEMTSFAQEKKLFLMEGMWTACMPFIEKTISLIKEDAIGKPQYLSADFGFFSEPEPEGRLWNKNLGGGSLLDVGIYPVFLATLIFGEPSVIKTIAKISNTGVDEYSNMILQYVGGAAAHLISSIVFNTPIEAEIIGTKGSIKIKNPWFKATGISVHLSDGSVESFHMPHQSNGFEHEILEVMACLDKGLLQSPKMPHSLTLSISRLLEKAEEAATG